jgi:alcohol dehydrogenase (NADP+)
LQADVRGTLEDSLRKLRLDYVDLYLMHWPVAQKKGGVPDAQSHLARLPSLINWLS